MQNPNTGAQGPSGQTKSFPDFNQSLPMSLLRARESVMRKFMPALQAHGLSAQQWRVMRALHEEHAQDLSTLAERCYLLKPSLSRIIRNLEARSIVHRLTDPQDQRVSVVSISPKGIRLFQTILPSSESQYTHITKQFGAKKLQHLHELLEQLVDALDDTDQEQE